MLNQYQRCGKCDIVECPADSPLPVLCTFFLRNSKLREGVEVDSVYLEGILWASISKRLSWIILYSVSGDQSVRKIYLAQHCLHAANSLLYLMLPSPEKLYPSPVTVG